MKDQTIGSVAAAAIILLVLASCLFSCQSGQQWALDNHEVVQTATDIALQLIATRQLGENTREKACLIESAVIGATTYALLAKEEITGLERMRLAVASAESFGHRVFGDVLGEHSLGWLAIRRLGMENVNELQAAESLISAALRLK